MLRQGAVLLVALLAVVTGGLIAVEQNATYSFSPEAVNSLAQQALKQAGENATAAKKVQTTVALVQQQYPNITSQNPKWLFNNAGGAMGSMLVLHASFSEYLIIFGTSIGTDGHSGRFRAHVRFVLLFALFFLLPLSLSRVFHFLCSLWPDVALACGHSLKLSLHGVWWDSVRTTASKAIMMPLCLCLLVHTGLLSCSAR